jgi:hypothetical protein
VQLRQLVAQTMPVLLAQPGVGPSAPPSCWCPGPTKAGADPRPPSPL